MPQTQKRKKALSPGNHQGEEESTELKGFSRLTTMIWHCFSGRQKDQGQFPFMAPLYLYTTNLQEAMDTSNSVEDMLQSEDYPPIPLPSSFLFIFFFLSSSPSSPADIAYEYHPSCCPFICLTCSTFYTQVSSHSHNHIIFVYAACMKVLHTVCRVWSPCLVVIIDSYDYWDLV